MPTRALATLEAATAPAVSLDTARLIAAKIAPATAKNYAALLGQFAEQLHGQQPSDANLAEYLTRRYAEGVAPGSLGVLVYAVRFWEKENDRPGQIVGKLSRDVMAGIRREGKGRGRGQVTGISREDVRVMLRATDTDTNAGARDAALLLVMSDGLLRISEAVAIDCEHITTQPDGSGRLLIPRSKTDQEGQGAVVFLHPRTVKAIEVLTARAGYWKGPLFRRMRKGDRMDHERLGTNGARRAVKSYAEAAGIEGASGHSLRIGTAQELAQRGANLAELMTAGRWESADQAAHYVKAQSAAKGAVARLLTD